MVKLDTLLEIASQFKKFWTDSFVASSIVQCYGGFHLVALQLIYQYSVVNNFVIVFHKVHCMYWLSYTRCKILLYNLLITTHTNIRDLRNTRKQWLLYTQLILMEHVYISVSVPYNTPLVTLNHISNGVMLLSSKPNCPMNYYIHSITSLVKILRLNWEIIIITTTQKPFVQINWRNNYFYHNCHEWMNKPSMRAN